MKTLIYENKVVLNSIFTYPHLSLTYHSYFLFQIKKRPIDLIGL